jgi:putative transposase
MPWKEITMDRQREDFINRLLEANMTFSDVCSEFGISRKVGYKWWFRFQENGLQGLVDQSRAPKNCPHRITDEMVQRIVELRQQYQQWGPKKIRAELGRLIGQENTPSESSIGTILQEHGLSRPRKLRRHVAATAPLADCNNVNVVWMYDFKGWIRTEDGKIFEPLTITDAQSRYLLTCESMRRKTSDAVWAVLERTFHQYGLPLRMRSDNGPPFATTGVGRLSRLAIKLIKAGVTPEWIRPGKPQDNGRHERFHLTLKNEIGSPPARTLTSQEHLMRKFHYYFNHQRPHEALGQVTPASVYTPSIRIWDGHLRSPEYPEPYAVRKVMQCGCIKVLGSKYFLSESLYQEPVGLKEIDNGVFQVWYGPISLGTIDLRKGFQRT